MLTFIITSWNIIIITRIIHLILKAEYASAEHAGCFGVSAAATCIH
jgi:hypothetical protein